MLGKLLALPKQLLHPQATGMKVVLLCAMITLLSVPFFSIIDLYTASWFSSPSLVHSLRQDQRANATQKVINDDEFALYPSLDAVCIYDDNQQLTIKIPTQATLEDVSVCPRQAPIFKYAAPQDEPFKMVQRDNIGHLYINHQMERMRLQPRSEKLSSILLFSFPLLFGIGYIIALLVHRRPKPVPESDISENTSEALSKLATMEKHSEAQNLWIQNIGHEIRTPIHNVLAYAKFGIEEAKDKEVDREELWSYFDRIFHRGQRLHALIDDLLDYGKLEAGKMRFNMESNNLHDITLQLKEEMEAKLREKNIELTIQKPHFVPLSVCDGRRILQVLINLLANAIRFSKEHQTIEIIFEKPTTSSVSVTMKDYGAGIPEEELDTIFDTFSQASTNGSDNGGTGLGLAICKDIIEAHNGTIEAHNHSMGGATFTFTLPVDHTGSNNDQ